MEFASGATAKLFSADKPDRLRGPQHHALWADELAAWRYARETWDMAMFGLRLGDDPRAIVTTTPRPIATLRQIMTDANTAMTRATSYDNRANLAPAFFEKIVKRYEGTRLGRQELMAELIDDVPGALWMLSQIDACRVTAAPELNYIVVAVDPSATSTDTSDEAGIVVAGRSAERHGYTLADYTRRGTPLQWATAAVEAYHRHGANVIVAEANNGGEMVSTIIRSVDAGVPVKLVWAADGKRTRAEPVSMLYEKNIAHHVGALSKLEDEMTSWVPLEGRSPNRIDALVWAYHELGLAGSGKVGF